MSIRYTLQRCALSLIALVLCILPSMGWGNATIELTPQEHNLLNKLGSLKVCIDPNWMPYEKINKYGKHEGISADYLQLIAEKIGVQLTLYPTKSWKESLLAAKERQCDLLSLANKTKDRLAYLNFTTPFTQYPYVIVTTNDKFYIDDIKRELHNFFAVTRGYTAIDIVRNLFPEIQIIEVDNIYDGIKLVRQGKVFGYIDSVLSIGYAIQTSGSLDLKISGTFDTKAQPAIGIRNDMPLLHTIFQKGVDAISEAEKQSIYNRWINLKVQAPFNYTPIWAGGTTLLCLLLGIFIWNCRIRDAHQATQQTLNELHVSQIKLQDKNRQLERMATTDILTGLNNRLKVDESLEQEVIRHNRYKTNLSMIMLDVDNFKNINDTFGHQAGDGVLLELAALLKNFSRATDIVGRWGGEEFLILCPETTIYGATQQAKQLQKIIESNPFPRIGVVTCSFGVTTIQPNETSEDLLSRSDQALYKAKNNGRNRVEIL